MYFLCAITNLTAFITIQGVSLELIPKNRVLCPPINQDTEVIFCLYTRQNYDEPQILKLNNDSLLKKSFMDFNKKTKIFFHGYIESHKTYMSQLMKNDTLEAEDVNMILVDTQLLLSGIDYISAAANVKPIANLSAQFIDYLTTKGLKLGDLQLFGISLGAHIAGLTGLQVKSGQVERVTGLDPASFLFTFKSSSGRITEKDAKYVDVIHTNAGVFGISTKSGKADFWINGGSHQPSCSPFSVIKKYGFDLSQISIKKIIIKIYRYDLKKVSCSHVRSTQIYGQSILNGTEFWAYKCKDGVRKFDIKLCDGSHSMLMGAYVNTSTEGDYVVQTPPHASYY